jgi:hypothetical protein
MWIIKSSYFTVNVEFDKTDKVCSIPYMMNYLMRWTKKSVEEYANQHGWTIIKEG